MYQNDGAYDIIVGPKDIAVKTDNFPALASIIGLAYAGGTPFQAEVFFINQLSACHVVEYSKTSADFTIDHQYTIEVGGRSKDGKQIAGINNSFIASADEEYVLGNKIPLWLFGFLY